MTKVGDNILIRKYQNGSKKNRSTKDNWLMIMEVLENNRINKQATYILFADAIKCFDKLWLEDCLCDLADSGMRERERSVNDLCYQ